MSPPDLAPDQELLALHGAVRRGDGAALARLAELLYPRVRAVVRRRLGRYGSDVIADAVQEAMLCIITYLPTSRATCDRQLVRWAGLVGWHAALRYLRSPAAGLATGWEAADVGAAELEAIVPPEPSSVGSRSPNPPADNGGETEAPRDESRVAAAVVQAFASAWASLDVVNARIVWCRVVLDHPYAELAAGAGTTPAGVKRRYQRSIAYLRRTTLASLGRLPTPLRAAALERLQADNGH